jgi:hypothetical protein
MGNYEFIDMYRDEFTSLDNKEIHRIRENYKVIDVAWLDETTVHSQMSGDKYFEDSPAKKIIVNNMVSYYLNHKDAEIYKKTDYICSQKAGVCVCNTNADAFRKIYNGENYDKKYRYIGWHKK